MMTLTVLARNADIPAYNFEEQRDCFAFNSLWTRVEAIVASGKVCKLQPLICNCVPQLVVPC